MKTPFACIVILLVAARQACAQSVLGTVLSEAGKPISSATISLLSAKDSAWLRSEVTGADGRYTLSYEAGNYLLQAIAEGKAQETKSCLLQKEITANISFSLLPKSSALEGITVTTKKPFIEAKPGMMVVNIEGSAVSAGNNALDLLKRSPGVQVSGDCDITLRGKNGVEVYVDGRPSRLSGAQLTTYLQAMTAEEIAQLELITQPSSKYDAAGTAGIINIRTRSVRKRGTNVALSSSITQATQSQGNGSARITYKSGKLTLYASEYFNYVDNHNSLRVDRRFYDAAGALTGNSLTEQDVRFHSRFHRIKAGGEYAISKSTTIGIRAQVPLGAPEVDYRNFTTINDLPNATSSYTLGTRSMSNRWYEREIGLLARHRFKDDAELTFDGYYVDNSSGDAGLFFNTPTTANGQAIAASDVWGLHFPVAIRVISAQSDYSRALGKKTKLEAGVKYRSVSIDNIADYTIPGASGVLVADTTRSTRYLYNEAVPAAYANITRTVNDKLEVQAGLRAELTVSEGSVAKTGDAFKRDYLSLFPTLYASYKADSLNTFTMSYGRRLDRPDYYQLNPSRDYVDKYSYRVGNPRLQPQFTNNVEIGYSWKGQLTATLSLTQTTSVISDFFVQDDKTKTAFETHDNIAGFRQGGLSLNYSNSVRKGWTLNLYGDFYLNRYSGNYYGVDYVQPGSSFSFNANNQFELGHKWSGELTCWYNGPSHSTVFTKSLPMGSADAAVSKKLLSDSLVIKLAVNDIFGTQVYRGENRFANFDTDVRSTWDARRAVLSLNYNFGSKIETLGRKNNAESRSM